jgi:predicted dehydrogenase
MKIPSIHVGCGKFSLQRLEILINGNKFNPVACVDIDLKKAKSNISSIKGSKINNLSNKVFTTITEAKKIHDAKACFIFVSSREHSKLVIESLNLGMHTFCVKSIACNQKEFKDIIKAHNSNPKLMLLQGFNNQWNEAATKMREWIQAGSGIGKMLGGECVCWSRQNLKSNPPKEDTTTEGMFFYALACHQLSQLVAAKGLPDYVTAYVHNRKDKDLGYRGVFGTSGGQCLFEYPDGVPFSYIGTRVAHENFFGFGSRWSGRWIIHGENGDIKREGGRLTLYRNGGPVEDYYLKDLDANLIEDERIQFNAFYHALKSNKDKKWLQQSSLDTWILMEACCESARKKEKILIQKLKEYCYGK